MPSPAPSVVLRNTVFAWIALGTGVLLLIPLAAMQVTTAVQWGVGDFVAMGLLLFGVASLFVLAARRVARRYWWAIGVVLALVFLYAWAELAVGVFTNLGS